MKKEKYIRLTRPLIREVFRECNEKYFAGEIEEPAIVELWTCHKKCVGWVRALWNKKKKGYVAALHISSRYRWTLTNLRNVVVHEMIHLYIQDYLIPLTFWQRIFTSRQHGKVFIEKMNELNATYGLDIQARAKFMKNELIK